MKRWIPLFVSFIAGATVASLIWLWQWQWQSFRREADLVMFGVGKLHEQAKMGEYILTYLDNSDPMLEKRLGFVASNLVNGFSSSLDVWDKEYPAYRIKWRYSSQRAHIDEFLLKRGMLAVTNNASTSRE